MEIKKFFEFYGNEPNYVPPVINIISTSDGNWHGLYVNGELKITGYDFENYLEVIHALGFEYKRIIFTQQDIDKSGGSFPKTYKEAFKIKKESTISKISNQRKITSLEDPYGEEDWS